MQQKIVDYELCQRLAELGFECPSHTGWWEYCPQELYDGMNEPSGWYWTLTPDDETLVINAYDCWDLLMWFQKQNDYWTNIEEYPRSKKDSFGVTVHQRIDNTIAFEEMALVGDTQPQNALALAAIKILEERQ